MKKKLLLVIISIVVLFMLFGIGKLYISYNLSYYAGYYVQQLPRKEGTNPEMAILLENLDFGPNVEVEGITYDTDGNGTIIKNKNDYLGNGELFDLWIVSSDKYFEFNKRGEFLRYSKGYSDKVFTDDKYRVEAQAYLDEILPPILKAQPKPSINLQWLFNRKYEKRFD